MIDQAPAPPRLSWRFPRVFWFANVAELFERAAYYGMFISLTLYLTDEVGFDDVQTSWIAGVFAAALYLVPTFAGALADRIGFRRSLLMAFACEAVGYTLLGALQFKSTALIALTIVMFGGALVKPVIAGTVAKCSDEAHRGRAFSIFYMLVNIGAFAGKTVARPLRTGVDLPGGEHLALGLQYINYYAALMALCGLVIVALYFRQVDTPGGGKSVREIWRGFLRVLANVRFLCLIVLVAGFWSVQGQLYATLPKYMLRLVGPAAAPEWLANINPFVVVLCVAPISHLMRRFRAETSIGVGLFIIPLTTVAFALAPQLQDWAGSKIDVLGLVTHPVTIMAFFGIGLQGLAECFLAPRFLEYASKQAPPGETGLYLGYQNLTSFFSWLLTGALSGRLLDWYCPDPNKVLTVDPAAHAAWQQALTEGIAMPAAYAHAHYVWLVWGAIGATAFVGLLVFKYVTESIDRRRAAGV